MEKSPHHRFETAGEFAAELRRFLNHESILTKPPGPIRRAGQKLRQHRIAAMLATIVILGMVLGGFVFADAPAGR